MATILSANRRGNQLLGALPPRERERLTRDAHQRFVEVGDTLYQPGREVSAVQFPLTAVVSILTILRDGSAVETATIGREGIVGTFLSLGDDRSPSGRAVVQMGGELLSIDAGRFRDELDRSPHLARLMDAYTRALLAHVSQTVACTAAHSVRQRLARWLLQTSDGVSADDVRLTHEFLATIIHARRASVTVALNGLQEAGALRTRRGGTLILDRRALEAEACECYERVRREYERLLPGEGASQLVPARAGTSD